MRGKPQEYMQAQKMVKGRLRVLADASMSDSVIIQTPAVDRGGTDPSNLIGVIACKLDNKGLHKIAVKSRLLDGKFTRNQFDICGHAMYSIEDMNLQRTRPVRKAVQELSNCRGQGFCSL